MRTLPRFTAVDALEAVGVVGRGQPPLQLVLVAWGSAKACNPLLLNDCQVLALERYVSCQRRILLACQGACGPFGSTDDPYCQQCIAREQATCVAGYEENMQACANQHDCPAGLECLPDWKKGSANPEGTCCPSGQIGQIACAANCLPPCNPPRVFYPDICLCACPRTVCPPNKPLNPATCRCECPSTPCPDYRMTRDPSTCACICPPPLTDCSGYCCDLANNPLCCGSCDAVPCGAFEELCCSGTCTNICTDANCGSCGRALQPGEKCCRPQCTPTKLGTDTNCSDCGDDCKKKSDRRCVGDRCQCPPGTRDCCPSPPCTNPCCPNTRECCNGVCCPAGRRCCNGACVDPNWDDLHCGGCNRPCPTGRVCINGVCECGSGTKDCGGKCIPSTTLCCQNQPCPANSTHCCQGCRDYVTLSNPQHSGWKLWRAKYPAPIPWATCPNEVFTCHPTLRSIYYPSIGKVGGCCPPTCSGFDYTSNMCTGCPP